MRNFQKRRKVKIKRETPAERLLERGLKKRMGDGAFIKQYPIGPYIVDFYIPRSKVVVEADGRQHYTGRGLKHDRKRDEYMERLGIETVRFTNEEIIRNIEEVLLKIIGAVERCKEEENF